MTRTAKGKKKMNSSRDNRSTGKTPFDESAPSKPVSTPSSTYSENQKASAVIRPNNGNIISAVSTARIVFDTSVIAQKLNTNRIPSATKSTKTLSPFP